MVDKCLSSAGIFQCRTETWVDIRAKGASVNDMTRSMFSNSFFLTLSFKDQLTTQIQIHLVLYDFGAD